MTKVSTDPIADMLTRIRNAIAVNKTEIRLPYSSFKEDVAKIIAGAHFIDKVDVDGEAPFKELILKLTRENQNSKITEIVRLSKPGRRTYANAKEIPVIKSGRGIVVVSTSKGIMTGDQARSQQVGGELICKVY